MVATHATLRNARTAPLRQANASANYGDDALASLSGNSGAQRQLLISFTKPCPPGATIVEATLTLYQRRSATGGNRTLTARRIAEGWKASSVNWNRKPTGVGSTITSQTRGNGGDDGREWTFDVTVHMQTVADGADWFGWQVESDNDTPMSVFTSQAPRFTPILEVSWSARPEQPETLSPSGNRAVSVAKPTLRFDFTDVGGDVDLAAVQVQINPANSFTSPAFDSGTVNTDDPELDLTTTSYGGLAVGSSTWWRVRVRDGAGLWSLWSDPAQFSRVAKGTLAITNPADVPAPVVEDTTPPIAWTWTGTTQRAFQVIVADPEETLGDWLWTSGKITSDEDSYTLPKGVITKDDAFYLLKLRVWDTVEREGTPGDRPYVQAVREFQFNDDPTVDPVTHLAAVVESPTPWVSVVWRRSDSPDEWAIWRDGELVEKLDGPDLLQGATTYRYRDREAAPRRDHTWKIRAVRNGHQSRNNPTVTARPAPTGVWLTDLDYDDNVCVVDAEVTADMVDVGENYEPVGSDRMVRVQSAMRGVEGNVTGLLMEVAGVTGVQFRRRLLRAKNGRSERFHLTWGDLSIPVKVYNVSVSPYDTVGVDEVDLAYNCRFDFHQAGGDLGFVGI